MKKLCIIFILTFFMAQLFCQIDPKVKCRLWEPRDFCNFPDSISIPLRWSAENCTWDFNRCEIYNMKPWKGVWITFQKDNDSTFNLESRYKNISLINNNTKKVIHPSAILWYRYNYSDKNCVREYMPSSFKAKKYTVFFKPKERVDLILIFKDAEVGDAITIDGFLKTTIQK